MIADGADIIFHAAGGTGLGVIESCKENGIWAIGVDSDQSYLAPESILTSAMKRVDNATYEISKACLMDTWRAACYLRFKSGALILLRPQITFRKKFDGSGGG